MSASPANRPRAVSTAYTAIALVFFFGIGLAGGTAYKFLYDNDSGEQIADASPAAGAPAPDFAQPMAHLTPSAPPALTPPPAPTSLPPSILVTPAAPQAEPVAPAPVPYAQVAPPIPDVVASPAPDVAAASAPVAAMPRAIAQRHAAPPKKPRLAAKTTPAATVATVALHEPPTAPANVAGPFFVQFGAFANEENARRMQWAVEATGLKVEVTQGPGASGQMLFYLRSPIYHDYASALSAAQTVQDRVQHFVNAIPVDYAILGDHTALEQQAQR